MVAKNFTIVRKGYDPEEVEDYISKLEFELLSYKKKEQAITEAIIKAQLAADQITLDAENKAKQMHKKAIEELHYIKDMINHAKDQLHLFQEEYNKMISRYIIDFNDKDLDEINHELDKLYDSLVVKDDDSKEEPPSFEGTQAFNLATKKQQQNENQQEDGLSKEELNSLFGK